MPTAAERIRAARGEESISRAPSALAPIGAPTAVEFPDAAARIRERRTQEVPIGGGGGIEPGEDLALAMELGQEALGEQQLPIGTRFDLGLSETFEEKRAKFRDKFPEGVFLRVTNPATDEDEVMFRRHPNEQFARVDKNLFEEFEPLMDLADFSGEIPIVAAELLTTKFLGTSFSILKQFMAGAGGQLTKEAIEELRGFQRQTLPQVLSDAAMEGGFSSTGVVGGKILEGPTNFFRHAGKAQTVGGRQARNIAARRGLPPMLPSQVARSPIIQKLTGQSGAMFSTVKDYVAGQNAAALQTISRLREPDLLKFMRGDYESLSKEAVSQLSKTVEGSGKTILEAGGAMKAGLSEWDAMMRTFINAQYAKARAIQTPTFSLSPAKAVADDVLLGVKGAAAEGGEVAITQASKEVQAIAEKIQRLDPSLPTVADESGKNVFDAVDQLRALQQSLWDLKTPNPGELFRKNTHGDAAALYDAVTDVLKKPTNADPKFVTDWLKANRLAGMRFTALENEFAREASKTNAPGEFVARLLGPNNFDKIKGVRAVSSHAQWRKMQIAAKGELTATENLMDLPRKLDSMDRATKKEMFTVKDLSELEEVSASVKRLQVLDLEGIALKEANALRMIDETLASGAGVEELVKVVGPPEAGRGKAIRAALIERAFRSAKVEKKGDIRIDPNALKSQLELMRETGAIKFLTKKDIRTLVEMQKVGEVLKASEDAGTAIAGAQAARGMVQMSPSAFRTFIENVGFANLIINEKFQNFLLGKPFKQAAKAWDLTTAGAIMASIAFDLEDRTRPQEQPEIIGVP